MLLQIKDFICLCLFFLTFVINAADVVQGNFKADGSEIGAIDQIGNISRDKNWLVFSAKEKYHQGSYSSTPLVYLRNISQKETFFLSQNALGEPADCCFSDVSPSITADAAQVLYLSDATNLEPSDTNDSLDLFIFNVNHLQKSSKNIYFSANLDATYSVPQLAFSITEPASYNHKFNTTIFDSVGQAHLLTIFFRKNELQKWNAYAAINDRVINTSGNTVVTQSLTFNDNGSAASAPVFTLTSSQLNVAINASSFNIDINIPWKNKIGSQVITQNTSVFSIVDLEQDGSTIGELSRFKNAEGKEFDLGIEQYWLIGESHDFFFTSKSSNVINEISSVGLRLFKYDASKQIISLIKDDFVNIYIQGQTTEGNKILVQSSRTLTDVENHQRALYLLDTINAEYTQIKHPEFINNNEYITDVIMDNQAKHILVRYGFHDYSFVLYDLDTDEITDLSQQLQQFYNIKNIIGFTPQGSGFLASDKFADATWFYDLQTKVGYQVNLDTANNLVRGSGKVNSYNNSFLLKSDNCHLYACFLNMIDLDTVSEPIPENLSFGKVSRGDLAKIELNFENVLADFYYVFRYPENQPELKQYIGKSYNTSYIDSNSGLQPDIVYSYEVKGCNRLSQCNSGFTMTGAYLIAPGKVTGLTKQIKSTAKSQTISWDEQENAQYKVELNAGTQTQDYRSESGSYTFNISQNLAYQVRVKACVFNVCGVNSEPLDIDAVYLPYVPSDFRYFPSVTLDSLILKWQPDPRAKFYKVYAIRNSSTKIFRKKVYRAEFHESVVSSKDSLTYYISACLSENECSSEASSRFVLNNEKLILATPKLLINSGISTADIKVTSTGSGYDLIRLYRRSSRFGQAELVFQGEFGFSESSNYNHFLIFKDPVEADTSYFYYVEACINQECLFSDDVKFSGVDGYLNEIDKIKNLQASIRTHKDKISLEWTVPDELISQTLQRRILGTQQFSAINTFDAEQNYYDDFNIEPGRKYEYKITYKIINQTINESNVTLGETYYGEGDVWIPEVPSIRSSLGRYYDKIKLTWSEQENISYYEIYYSEKLTEAYQKLVTHSGLNYTLYNLVPGTQLYMKIKACTLYQCSTFSSPLLTATSKADSAPEASVAPTLSLTQDNQVKISLTAKTGASYYEIKRFKNLYSTAERTFSTEKLEFIDSSVSESHLYYYRIKSCNAFDCAAMSEYSEIMTDPKHVTKNKKEYYISSASHSFTEHITLSLRVRGPYSGQLPKYLNIYMSQSRLGTKQLLMRQDNLGSEIVFEQAQVNTKYYFWLENCYEENDCYLDPYYKVGVLEPQPNQIPPPEGFMVSKGERIDFVNFSWKRNFEDTITEIFVEDERHEVLVASSSTRTSNHYTKSQIYKSETKKYMARTCYKGLCSDFSEAILGWPASKYTNKSKLDESGRLWDQSFIKFEGELSYRLPLNVTSKQMLFHRNGYSLTSRLYLKAGEQPYANCGARFITSWVQKKYSSIIYKEPIFSVIKASDSCDSNYLTDIGSYYLIFNDNYAEAIKITLPEEQWFELSLKVDVNNVAQLSLPGQPLVIKQLPKSVLLPDFASLNLSSDSYSAENDLITSIQYVSLSDFDVDRPYIQDLYVGQTSRGSTTAKGTFNGIDLGASSQWRLYKKLSNEKLEFVKMYSLEDGSTELDNINLPNVNATYLMAVRSCKTGECSAYKFTEFSARGAYLSQPQVKIKTGTRISTIGIEWDAVTSAIYYQIFAGQSYNVNNTEFTMQTTDRNYALEGLSEGVWYIWVKACISEGHCSDYSNRKSAIPEQDSDGDGITNSQEIELGTDPYDSDTDGDDTTDGADTYPLNAKRWTDLDTDSDTITDDIETLLGLNINDANDVWQDDDGDRLPLLLELQENRNQSEKDNDVFSMPRLFVHQAAVDITNQFASEQDITDSLASLNESSTTPADIYSSLLDETYFSYMGFVGRVYQAVLGREPDLAGARSHYKQLIKTQNKQAMVNAFVNSAEFQTTYGQLSNSQFVDLVYINVLGRAADPGGHVNWLSLLDTGTMMRAQMMLGFIDSAEYIANQDISSRIALLHLFLTGSNASIDMLSGYKKLIVTDDNNMSNGSSIVRAILASDGYYNSLMQTPRVANADTDQDGIPDGIEFTDGTLIEVKDNDVHNNDRLFVIQMLRDLLGEEWSYQIIKTQLTSLASMDTRADWLKTVLDDPRIKDKRQAISRLYYSAFLRQADHTGLMNWIRNLEKGSSLSSIATAFTGSGEFNARYGSLDNDAFVDLIYVNVLGRVADAGGRNHWINQLNSGLSRGAMLVGFSESVENRNTHKYRGQTILLFNLLLQRAPSDSELAAEVSQLKSGVNITSLINTIFNSSEYRNRFY